MGAGSARVGVGALALLCAVLVGVPDALATTPVQLTTSGDVREAKVSLDGSTVVYLTFDVAGPEELFSVPIGGGTATRIDTNIPDFFQKYELSPDSSRVVYSAGVGSVRLLSVPIGGGSPATLWTGTATFEISPDSHHVAFTAGAKLYSIPISGGSPTELDSGPVGQFQVSPDSSRVVYDSGGKLMVVPLGGGPKRTLSQSVDTPDGLLITRDALRVVFKDQHSPAALDSVPITGGPVSRLSPPGGGSDAVGDARQLVDGVHVRLSAVGGGVGRPHGDTLSIYRPSELRFYIINELGENEGGLGAAVAAGGRRVRALTRQSSRASGYGAAAGARRRPGANHVRRRALSNGWRPGGHR